MGCRVTSIDDLLRSFFGWLGYQVGKRPVYFIIVPVLLTALCASGFQRITYEADPEYLFSPQNGEAKFERAQMEKHFPMNYSAFHPGRISRHGRFGRLLIRARDNGTLLRNDIFQQIMDVDYMVRNLTIVGEHGYGYSYEELCALVITGGCWQNEILGLGKFMPQIEAGEMSITYPIWFDPDTFLRYDIPFFTGGVSLSEDSTITEMKYLALNYFLTSATDFDVQTGTKWEDAFLTLIRELRLPGIEIMRFSSLSMERELENNTNSVIPFFSLNLGVMIAFCIITCMMTDWVKSKPVLGLLGVFSAILATIASLGTIMYCGMPFIGINLAAPFLMLGIGIDDTFVMLGAWRRTSLHASVPERMRETFKDAAVSITITSVTDMLSFFVGVITPFPCVRIFCVYTGASVAFTYVWHITFFGACMAIAGYAERQNRHALTCLPVIPKSRSKSRGFLYNVFCAGGIDKENPLNPKDNRENGVMVFFRDQIGPILNKGWTKFIVMVLFVVYLGVSSWGVSQLREGLERRKLSRYDSYTVAYYDTEDLYFREYPYRVNVVISGVYDYSSPEVQEGLERLILQLENTTYIDPFYTESWLREFLDFVRRNKDYNPIDISTEASFIESLNTTYLATPNQFTEDVDFSSDGQHIIGARFMIQGAHIYDTNQEQIFVEELRAVCHNSQFNVTVFHPFFIFFDQFLMVFPTTVQCVSVAAVIMFIVALLLIPNKICSLWVAFSIISIELGVVGFMTLWDVNLDSISMINLIMCIGFSVDFSAHISYHFMSRKDMPVKERVKDSMYALGLPILQGAISTILGVIGLALAPSYIFLTFFKMVLLVIVLGALHGLILLPVLLSFLGPGTCCGLQTEEAGASVAESGKKKALPITHKNGSNNPVPPKQSQTYLDEGLYEGPPSSVEVSMKIPRPKHCSRNSDLFQSSSNNGGTNEGEAPFHSDNYLQAATKNKRRTSRLSSADNQPVNGAPPVTGAPQAGINLREMYTNRAFKD